MAAGVFGLTFNWGALVGWTAATGELAPAALVLYAAGFFWTLGYDTIYAHQDKVDDALIGVRSSALWLGAATPRWLWGFYGVSLALLALTGALAGMGPWFYPALLLVCAHLAWQFARSTRTTRRPASRGFAAIASSASWCCS